MRLIFPVLSPARRVFAIIALLLFFGLAAPVLTAPKLNAALTVAAADDTNQRFRVAGTVESVSYAANTVRIRAGDQIVSVTITPTTAIEFRGEAGSIADILHGRKIVASGVVRDGAMVAHSIVLK